MKMKTEEDFINEVATIKLQNIELLEQIDIMSKEFKTLQHKITLLNEKIVMLMKENEES